MRSFHAPGVAFFAAVSAACLLRPAAAGVTNPDLSALGQVLGGWTDDPASADRDEATLKLGEAEFIIDAALNPYLKGWFTLSGGPDGIGLEEAYASVVRGLPWGLGLKAGKYRLPFGKLNPTHPHALPFIDPPRSASAFLFGEDGFNETAAEVSDLLPTPGDWASMLTAAVIEGRAFHGGQSGTRLGWMGRWANDFLLGERGALETGLSGATGIDSIGPDTRAYLAGADVKAKFYLESASQLTLQAEGFFRHAHPGGAAEDRSGFYAFGDYRYHMRWNGGLLYEQWEREGGSAVDRGARAFLGYAVLEESTLLRLAYERVFPEGGDAFGTVTLQLLFSMGPHKAHQF
jgi:hypothetical protein